MTPRDRIHHKHVDGRVSGEWGDGTASPSPPSSKKTKWRKKPIDLSDTNAVVKRCLEVGKKYLPKESPTIYNRHDVLSDFLYGVHRGLKKIKWDIGDPIFYLVQSGLFKVREKRKRAFQRFLTSRCECCAKKIKFMDKPCHGLTKEIFEIELVTDLVHRCDSSKEVRKALMKRGSHAGGRDGG